MGIQYKSLILIIGEDITMKDNLKTNIKDIIKNNQKKIKIIGILIISIILLIMVLVAIFKEQSKQKYIGYNGKNLKESKYPGYKKLIDELQERHPNWTFTLFYTKLDWEDVIENEGHSDTRRNPLNVIPDSSYYPEDWKCEIDKNKAFDNGTWLCASNKAIKHQMDIRNVLNEENIFQLKELNYVKNSQTEKGIREIIKGTFLEKDSVIQALLQASQNANLDPYFVASRLIQEQGRNGTVLAKGYKYKENIIYNVFNVKASGNSTTEILENAAKYSYDQGWDTMEKSIIGGIEFVKKGYINRGQNTLYLQKFDIVKQDGSLYTNQYMQNLMAPKSEASNMLKIYKASGTVDSNLNFIIPLYENMPEEIE